MIAALELSEKLHHFTHDGLMTMVAVVACVALFAYWVLKT